MKEANDSLEIMSNGNSLNLPNLGPYLFIDPYHPVSERYRNSVPQCLNYSLHINLVHLYCCINFLM